MLFAQDFNYLAFFSLEPSPLQGAVPTIKKVLPFNEQYRQSALASYLSKVMKALEVWEIVGFDGNTRTSILNGLGNEERDYNLRKAVGFKRMKTAKNGTLTDVADSLRNSVFTGVHSDSVLVKGTLVYPSVFEKIIFVATEDSALVDGQKISSRIENNTASIRLPKSFMNKLIAVQGVLSDGSLIDLTTYSGSPDFVVDEKMQGVITETRKLLAAAIGKNRDRKAMDALKRMNTESIDKLRQLNVIYLAFEEGDEDFNLLNYLRTDKNPQGIILSKDFEFKYSFPVGIEKVIAYFEKKKATILEQRWVPIRKG